MFDALKYDFMQNALFAGILVSIACGIIGTYVVVNRVVFISGGIAHAAYGGIGLGYFLGIDPFVGALLASIVSALSMGLVQRKTSERTDTVIGVMWAIGMAVGILFIDLTPGYAPDLMSYLFGSILAVPRTDILIMIGLDLVIILLVYIFYKELLAISYDEVFARVQNVPVDTIFLVLFCLVGFTSVMLMRVVGLILVIALLTIPAAIAGQFTKKLKTMMFLASLLGIFFTLSGIYFSFILNLTCGATIIIVAGTSFFLSLIYRSLKRARPLFR